MRDEGLHCSWEAPFEAAAAFQASATLQVAAVQASVVATAFLAFWRRLA